MRLDLDGQESDRQAIRSPGCRHPQQGNAGILTARFFKGGDAIGDGFNACQRGGAVGKSPQDQEQGQRGQASFPISGGSTTVPSVPVRIADKPNQP